ncbi:MAG: Slp family lipoprotein [Paraglaciecola sp.]|uniref:Slp family lipoprotein n=1 Tax=Paraglaciecola sp. TaxID=1920173 RepID=UPI003297FFDA
MKAFFATLLSSVLLIGCTSMPSELHITKSQQLISFVNVSDESVGKTVMWGGVITELRRQNGVVKGKVAQYPLNQSGQPMLLSGSGGSFIANFDDVNSVLSGAVLTLVGEVKEVINPYPDLRVTQVVTVNAEGFYVWDGFSRADNTIADNHNPAFIERGKWGWSLQSQNRDERERLERKQHK